MCPIGTITDDDPSRPPREPISHRRAHVVLGVLQDEANTGPPAAAVSTPTQFGSRAKPGRAHTIDRNPRCSHPTATRHAREGRSDAQGRGLCGPRHPAHVQASRADRGRRGHSNPCAAVRVEGGTTPGTSWVLAQFCPGFATSSGISRTAAGHPWTVTSVSLVGSSVEASALSGSPTIADGSSAVPACERSSPGPAERHNRQSWRALGTARRACATRTPGVDRLTDRRVDRHRREWQTRQHVRDIVAAQRPIRVLDQHHTRRSHLRNNRPS